MVNLGIQIPEVGSWCTLVCHLNKLEVKRIYSIVTTTTSPVAARYFPSYNVLLVLPDTNLPPWMKNKTGLSSFGDMDLVHILSARQSSLKSRPVPPVAVAYMRSNVEDLLGKVGRGGAGLKGQALGDDVRRGLNCMNPFSATDSR